MKKEDIDKLEKSINDALLIMPDVEEAKKSDDKISLMEGGMLVIRHGGKAINFISNIQEIANEIIDLDVFEAEKIYNSVSKTFGGNEDSKEAIRNIVIGAASISQGIQKLLEIRG